MDGPLASIRERFRRRCADDLALVRRSLNRPDELADPDFQRVVHQLSGMAGSIGFHDLSRIAGEMDDLLLSGGAPQPADLRRLESALAEIATDPGAGQTGQDPAP